MMNKRAWEPVQSWVHACQIEYKPLFGSLLVICSHSWLHDWLARFLNRSLPINALGILDCVNSGVQHNLLTERRVFYAKEIKNTNILPQSNSWSRQIVKRFLLLFDQFIWLEKVKSWNCQFVEVFCDGSHAIPL